MQTYLKVLSEKEKHQVHERSLEILAQTGVQVETPRGCQILREAGAEVDEATRIVKIPRALVEEALRLAPKKFTLGARRPGMDLHMNAGDCTLIGDGEGIFVIDRITGEQRPAQYQDWLEATRLIDALDEVGVYWAMVQRGRSERNLPQAIHYWRQLFANFSKHVQDVIPNANYAPWLLEVLQVIFGDQETIRKQHPYSFLLCPQSPLIIDQQYTDAYLALTGWDIPAAIMPMPLMGGTSPASMISTVILGNCEVLGMLCLLQAASPGTPCLYAPVLSIINPRTALYSAGAIENSLLSSAAVEMARYYDLPSVGTGGGTDQFIPGVQASYERALTSIMPVLSWPDLFVGAGLVGSSTILSLEQLILDVEIFRMNLQAHRGIPTNVEKWLDDVITQVGPGGHYLLEKSTVEGMRSGEWRTNRMGVHTSFETWEANGRPIVLDEARQKVEQLLACHQPLPLDPHVERELASIHERALNTQSE